MSLTDLVKRGPGRPRKVPTTAVQDALAAPLPDGLAEALAEAEKAYDAFSTASNVASRMRETETLDKLDRRARAAQHALQRALAAQDVARHLGDDGPSDEELTALREAADTAKAARDNIAARDEGFAEEIRRRGAIFAEAFAELDGILAPWQEAVRKAAEDQVLEARQLIAEGELAAKQSAPNSYSLDVHFNPPKSIEMPHGVEPIVEKAAFFQRHAIGVRVDRQFADWNRKPEPEPVPQAINGFINGRMDLRPKRLGGES